jgi:hypothetical protein
MGLTNAFGMVPPVYALHQWLADTFGLNSELLILLIIFALTGVLLPVSITLLAGTLSRRLTRTGHKYSLRATIAAFAPAFVPVGLGIWIAHYTFHLLIGFWTIVPVFQEFLGLQGDWVRFNAAPNMDLISAVQLVGLIGGLLWSLMIAQRAAMRLYRRDAVPGLLPWALTLIGVVLLAVWILGLPMEMRGSTLFS